MFKNKVAVVTGSSRGIGKGIAIGLARSGASVVINCRSNRAAAEQVLEEIKSFGGEAGIVQADVSERMEVGKLVNDSWKMFGDINILVNNAGVAHFQPIDAVTEEDWDETLRVNLKSVFLVTQAVLPAMRKNRWGRIINISSVAARTGGIVSPQYTASKAGIIGLTRYYANALVREGITVNAVAPSLIETDMIKGAALDPNRIPAGRFGTVEEVASAVLFLAGNEFVTGQTLDLNGGMTFR